MEKKDYQIYTSEEELRLESGEILPNFQLAYHTYGKLNNDRSNVVWLCHGITANSDVRSWWGDEVIGEGRIFDPEKHFIICVNMLGSCYGSTGATSINPSTGKPYFKDFPLITIRDIAKAYDRLISHLQIEQIYIMVGPSIGGFQVLEYNVLFSHKVANLILLVTAPQALPWFIAINEAQRMAIQSDNTFMKNTEGGGDQGLRAARAIAMLSYRNATIYNDTQQELQGEIPINQFRASSYQQYQGEKLTKRFDAYSYYALLKTADTHHLGRGRQSIESALETIRANTLVIALENDLLFSVAEQIEMAQQIPQAKFVSVYSKYGHDGFLVDAQVISEVIQEWKTEYSI